MLGVEYMLLDFLAGVMLFCSSVLRHGRFRMICVTCPQQDVLAIASICEHDTIKCVFLRENRWSLHLSITCNSKPWAQYSTQTSWRTNL